MSMAGAKPASSTLRGRVIAVLSAAVLVALAAAAWRVTQARREAAETLARLPERPELDASRQKLAPLLDSAIARVQADPSAENVGELGRIYQANYYYDEGAACYERAMTLDPREAQWPYLLAYVRSMKGDMRDIDTLLDRTIALDGTYLPAILRRADNRYKAGDGEGAKADYARCLDLHVNNPYARLGLARVAKDAEDWTTAEQHLRSLLSAHPQFGVAHRLLATVYEAQGKEEEQKRALASTNLLGRFEASPDPWVDGLDRYCFHVDQLLTKGFHANDRKRPEEAVAYYRRALELDPDNFEANSELGEMLQKMDRFAEAAPYLEKAVSLPARNTPRDGELSLNLGNNYYWQGRYEEAIPLFQKALELDATMEPAHHGLAGCYLELKRPLDAIPHCEKALELRPESFEARYNWGQALLQLGEVEAAMVQYAEAARLEPSLPSAEYKAGTYYYERGEMEKAIPYLERALEQARSGGNPQLAARIQSLLGR
ncbi:MAG: tetratricopeptide repeat protein [Candidatus Hydrogenedentes bacterium]|nr:tetratricopeptide repeat protein [Candidatus Hydrogenedentota bacterium]